MSEKNLFKGVILVTILWWFWFRNERHEREHHLFQEYVLSTLVSCFVALFLARALALTAPFRLRPLHNPDLNFQLPYTMQPTGWDSWSSFPSDHAILFFALATGIWSISRVSGALTFTYVVVAICFPRIYLGLHYPTDILAGAIIGIGIAWLANTQKIRRYVALPAMHWLHKAPGSFYACFFLLTYQIASLFDDVRVFGRFFFWVLRKFLF